MASSDESGSPDVAPPTEDLEDLYENAPSGYLSLRPDGRVFKVNATLATWLGIPAADLVGRHFRDLLNMAGRIYFETHFAPLLRMQGFFHEVALDFVTGSGDRLPVLVNAAERRDGEGRHLFTRLTVFNATERRRYERELLATRAATETAKKELERIQDGLQTELSDERAAAALREQFIAVLGHDLRNPLAAISSVLYLLLTMPLDDRGRSTVNMAQRSVRRMSDLIDNVEDFARGRLGGGLPMRYDDEPLEPVLQHVVDELQATKPARTIERHFALGAPVACDSRRIAQLASNLLSNALTHGAEDTPVRIGACTEDGWFELFVTNGGEPIAPAVLGHIFEPFSRGRHHPGKKGLGLGLYICREIALAHGGTLEATSTAADTRFTFRMPTQRAEPRVDNAD